MSTGVVIVLVLLVVGGIAAGIAIVRANRRAASADARANGFEMEKKELERDVDALATELETVKTERDNLSARLIDANRALAAARAERNQRHEANAQTGAPGGDRAVDAALDRLHPDADGDRREDGPGRG